MFCNKCSEENPYVEFARQSLKNGTLDLEFELNLIKHLLQMYDRNFIWRRERRQMQKIFLCETNKNWCDECYERTLKQDVRFYLLGDQLVFNYVYCADCCVKMSAQKALPRKKSIHYCSICKEKDHLKGKAKSVENVVEDGNKEIRAKSEPYVYCSSPLCPMRIPAYLGIISWREHPLFKEAVAAYEEKFGSPSELILKNHESQTMIIELL